MPHVGRSHARRRCRRTIPLRAIRRDCPLIDQMIAEGYTGRKGKGGFYRLTERAAARSRRRSTSQTGEYRTGRASRARQRRAAEGGRPARARRRIPTRAAATPGRAGRDAGYAAALVPEIADDRRGRRSGHAARLQLELRPVRADRPARRRLARRRAEARGPAGAGAAGAAPRQAASTASRTAGCSSSGTDGGYRRPVQRPTGVLLLVRHQARRQAVARNGSAALWDIGDGVACLEFTSKMNALDHDTLAMLARRHRSW